MDFELDEAIMILQITPSVLRAWLSPLPPEWVVANNGEGTWSPYDIVGHLIHGERSDWIPRAKILLSDAENREFEPFDQFAMLAERSSKSIQDLLDDFEDLRRHTLEQLRELPISVADYPRTGVHPTLGSVTLRQLLATWVAHDLNHLGQIAEVMARQYMLEVGPWKDLLDILGP